jgi:hypothetical protein
MTATLNADQTVDISGNLFALDSLVEAYQEILDQAKTQLENLELTDDQLMRVQRWAADRINYRTLGGEVADLMYGNTNNIQDFSHHIQTYVWERLCSRENSNLRVIIKTELSKLVDDRFRELSAMITGRVEGLLEDARFKAAREAQAEQDIVKTLVHKVFGDELKTEIVEQAALVARQMQAQQSEAAAPTPDFRDF